jgi:hypothetical protein
MAYRLSVLGGAGSQPVNATTVLTLADRTDTTGRRFREVIREQTFASYEAARAVAATQSIAETVIVGLDPWRTAFPIDRVPSLVQIHAARTADQPPTEAPWVRLFEVR